MANDKPYLLMRGAVSDPKAMPDGQVALFHRPGQAWDIVTATQIKDEFSAWHKELLSAGNAIIHDKIVVIDPLSDDPIVVTGSHNLGYKASYENDENLLIIRGNRALARAYAVHVLDVYDHYRFRYMQSKDPQHPFKGYLSTTSDWQTPYVNGAPKGEVGYWLTGGEWRQPGLPWQPLLPWQPVMRRQGLPRKQRLPRRGRRRCGEHAGLAPGGVTPAQPKASSRKGRTEQEEKPAQGLRRINGWGFRHVECLCYGSRPLIRWRVVCYFTNSHIHEFQPHGADAVGPQV